MISLILLKLFTFSQIQQGVPKLSHATVAQMCNAALKPKQKTYCNKNGRGEFIIPCTFEVNVCTELLFSYSSYHCVVMKSVVPHNFGGRDGLWGALIRKNLNCWNKEF